MVWEKVADIICRKPKTILFIIFFITIFFGAVLFFANINTRQDAFMEDVYKKPNEMIKDVFNQHAILSLTFEGKDNQSVLSLPSLKEQYLIIEKIKERYDVETESIVDMINNQLKRAQSNLTIMDIDDYDEIGFILFQAYSQNPYEFERNSRRALSEQYYIDKLQELEVIRAHSGNMLDFNQVSFNAPYVKSSRALVMLKREHPPPEAKNIFVEIRKFAESYSDELIVRAYAAELFEYDMDKRIEERIALMVIVIGILVACMLWLVFRKPSFIILPMVEVVLALIWTFGLGTLFGVQFTFSHFILIPIIFGYGLDDDIYFGMQFLRAAAGRNDKRKIIIHVLKKSGKAMFLASLTTMITFICIAFTTSLMPMITYALLAAVGILFTFSLSILINGSVRSILKLSKSQKEVDIFKNFGQFVFSFIKKRSKLLLIILIVLSVFSLWNIQHISTEFRASSFLAEDMKAYQANEFEQENFESYFPHYVLFVGDIYDPDNFEKMRILEERMANYSYIEHIHNAPNIESVHYVMKKFRPEILSNKTIKEKYDYIRDSDALINPVMNISSKEQTKKLLNKDKNVTLMIFWQDITTASTIRDTYSRLKQDIKELDFKNMKVIPAGEYFAGTLTADGYTKSGSKAFFLSLIIILIVVYIIYRKAIYLIAAVPVIFSALISLGLMPLLDIKLTAITVEISAITIGLGIDFGIHMMQRYHEEQKHEKKEKAILKTLQKTGSAITISALTTILAFMAFSFLLLPVTRNFGILLAIALFFAFISSILIIPVLLLKFHKN